MNKIRVFIKVEGIVQGVGFRPFVYNLAAKNNLYGWVNNNSEGVYIDIEGLSNSIFSFIHILKNTPPPLARIENIIIDNRPIANYNKFIIKESEKMKEQITLISPDIATCRHCINDIKDPQNRRYKYPFTNCTNCGPRFSIIKAIPYDRDKTTMANFKMCKSYHKEYTSPLNRRFHTQPNACSNCGPHVWIADSKGNSISCKSVIEYTQNQLKKGKIFAIKGLCGFHLVCDGQNYTAVNLLRKRKIRPHKPFAVMMKNIDIVKKYCSINKIEENLLTGIIKPIVLLNRNIKIGSLPKNIAPNQNTLGVMLPYTPLHELIFQRNDIEILVMTSANTSGLPLEYDNKSAVKNLGQIVDYFLLHNRDIHIPVDDSIVKVINNEVRIIRRARGYVPNPIKYESINSILACGSNMKNTFCISKEDFLFLSQYNGDLENLETYEHYKRNIQHFKSIFSFKAKYIAHDMHPHYVSTEYAKEYDLTKIPVQHHHAHIVSCMIDNNLSNTNVIGVSFDGTGFGTDNKIWGGEFFICNHIAFERMGHLAYMYLPGGEKAIKEPWRIGVSYIYSTFIRKFSNSNHFGNLIITENIKSIVNDIFGKKSNTVLKMLKKNLNCIETSSMGRLFDAVSSIIGIRDVITYEGQASIEMEALITAGCNDFYDFDIVKKYIKGTYKYIIEPYKIIEGILKDKKSNISKEIISSKFHNTVIKFSIEMCKILRDIKNINSVCLSGGVFQNSYLLENFIFKLKEEKFNVYTHKNIPTNDSGISTGQIIIANEKIKHNS